jgi:hypothetical protein
MPDDNELDSAVESAVEGDQNEESDQENEEAEEEDIPYASFEDFTIETTEDGEVVPQEVILPSFGKAEVIPIAYEALEDLIGNTQDAEIDFGPDQIARIFNNHVHKPDKFNRVKGHDIKKMKGLGVSQLLTAVFEKSGGDVNVQMQSGGGATVSFQNQKKTE